MVVKQRNNSKGALYVLRRKPDENLLDFHIESIHRSAERKKMQSTLERIEETIKSVVRPGKLMRNSPRQEQFRRRCELVQSLKKKQKLGSLSVMTESRPSIHQSMKLLPISSL